MQKRYWDSCVDTFDGDLMKLSETFGTLRIGKPNVSHQSELKFPPGAEGEDPDPQ